MKEFLLGILVLVVSSAIVVFASVGFVFRREIRDAWRERRRKDDPLPVIDESLLGEGK